MQGVREPTAIRASVAVTAGAALGVVLVVMAVAIHASLQQIAASSEGRFLLFPMAAQVLIAAGPASEAALAVALVSVPIWWGLTRAGLNGLPWAAGLGFVVTMAY